MSPPLKIEPIVSLPVPIQSRLRIAPHTPITLLLWLEKGPQHNVRVAVNFRTNTTGKPLPLTPEEVLSLYQSHALTPQQKLSFLTHLKGIVNSAEFYIDQNVRIGERIVDKCILRPVYTPSIRELAWRISHSSTPIFIELRHKEVHVYSDAELPDVRQTVTWINEVFA